MGLPDTSPKPKNDSMGMDYIPVYADEGAQGDPPGTVRISPGRLQTLGVRTEAAEMRPAADAVRSRDRDFAVRRAASRDGHDEGARLDRAFGRGRNR